MVSRYLPGDETGRDIGGARDAIDDFKQLLERYPDSEFAEDATLRLIYVRNQLAEYEVNVSRYYIRRGAYLAAANRSRQVVEGYPSTPAVIDALIVMHLSFEALGLPQESQDALFVLSENYPQYVVGGRGDQRLAPGVLYEEGETLTSILSLGFLGQCRRSRGPLSCLQPIPSGLIPVVVRKRPYGQRRMRHRSTPPGLSTKSSSKTTSGLRSDISGRDRSL